MAVTLSYDGQILLSTFWDQDGVIKCGNNTEVVYEKYTPVDPET